MSMILNALICSSLIDVQIDISTSKMILTQEGVYIIVTRPHFCPYSIVHPRVLARVYNYIPDLFLVKCR